MTIFSLSQPNPWLTGVCPCYSTHEYQWLTADGSLTRRLEAFGRVDVSVTRESSGLSLSDETHWFNQEQAVQIWQREVVLSIDGEDLVKARSVCTEQGATEAWQAIKGLGTQPLANLLYHDPSIYRSGFEHTQLNRHMPMFWELFDRSDETKRLLARRSVFTKEGQALIVAECFLPAFWEKLS